jgi:hypothetical protein
MGWVCLVAVDVPHRAKPDILASFVNVHAAFT